LKGRIQAVQPNSQCCQWVQRGLCQMLRGEPVSM